MKVKSILKSKTFWLGIAQIIAAIAEYFAGLPAGATYIQIASGVLTIIARFFTNSALAGTPGAKMPKKG
jgi:hypothetical protein